MHSLTHVLRLIRPAGRAVCSIESVTVMLVTIGALGLQACRDLTAVDAPDVVQPDDYATAAGATALAAGAITQFHQVFGGFIHGGGGVALTPMSGIMADELFATATAPNGEDGARDSRNPRVPASDVLYEALHGTRQRLLSAIGIFQQVAPDSTVRIGQLFALLGYTSVFLGENYCAGVPLSHRDADLRPVYGDPLTTAQLFDSAGMAFDSALAYGAGDARVTDLARVGRGRVLLDQGRFSEAAQAVTDVPLTYEYLITYLSNSDAGFSNGFFLPGTGPVTGFTVPEREGGTGLDWRSANDPRVELVAHPEPLGTDTIVGFVPYQAPDRPILLAGGIEARLIEAEGALQAGDATTWLTIHNTLRATVSGLGPLVDPASPAARVDLHFRERAFWLFLTAHRLGDLRRLVRQYGRDPETVFPTGVWRDGIRYGTATNMAPPTTQTANPNYEGCLSREA